MNKRHVLLFVGLVTASGSAGFGLKTVLASGIPTSQALYYSGTLVENGAPVSGSRSIVVNLWTTPVAAAGEGAPLCTTSASPQVVTNGRFRVPLVSTCVTQIGANPNTYVEVIDNGTSLGRTPVGAVPYAVEANHAVSADNAAAGGGIATSLATLQASVPAITSWAPYTPTVTAAGAALPANVQSSTGYWRRVGDSIDVQISTAFTSCPTVGGELFWSLPNNLTIDSSKLQDYQSVGSGLNVPADAASSVTALNVTAQLTGGEVAVDLSGAPQGGASCVAVGPGGSMRFQFQVPVSQYASASN